MQHRTRSRLKKNWRLNCLFSKMSLYSESLQQRFCTQNKTKKKSRKLYFRSGNKIYIQSRLNLKGLAKRPKTSLKKTFIQKNEIAKNCPFFPSLPHPLPTVIAFHCVKKSPLIIGIVDRIKIFILSIQRVRAVPCFLQIAHFFRHILRLFCSFRGDRSGMDKSSSATCF